MIEPSTWMLLSIMSAFRAASATVVDPEVVGQVVHGVGYGVATFMAFVWSEVRRNRAAKQHATRQIEQTTEQERKREERRERDRGLYEQALNYRFGEVHRQLAENRQVTKEELQELSLEVGRISAVVGVSNDNGVRGELREMRQRFDTFMRDELNARRE